MIFSVRDIWFSQSHLRFVIFYSTSWDGEFIIPAAGDIYCPWQCIVVVLSYHGYQSRIHYAPRDAAVFVFVTSVCDRKTSDLIYIVWSDTIGRPRKFYDRRRL